MRVVTRLFDSRDEAANAVDDLEATGVAADRISFVAAERTPGETRAFAAPAATPVAGRSEDVADPAGMAEVVDGAGKGALTGAGVGLLAGIAAVTIPGLGVAAAVGWLTAAFAGAATGAAVGSVTGGFLGALKDAGVDEEDAHVYAESVRRGSAMVLVRAEDRDADQVAAILRRHGGVELEDRRRELLENGWERRDYGTAPVPSGAL